MLLRRDFLAVVQSCVESIRTNTLALGAETTEMSKASPELSKASPELSDLRFTLGDCSKLTGINRGNNRVHKRLHQHSVAENGRLDTPCHVLLARSLPDGPFPAIGESPTLIVPCNRATVFTFGGDFCPQEC